MKDRFKKEMDPKLEAKLRDLTVRERRLMADILAGIAREFRLTARQLLRRKEMVKLERN